jgi:hypothetical protein
MILRIIVGILGTALGLSMLLKTEWYLQMIGRNEWAERHFGFEGGSRLLYKLIGFAIILLSWIYAFNWMNNLLEFFLGGLFGR